MCEKEIAYIGCNGYFWITEKVGLNSLSVILFRMYFGGMRLYTSEGVQIGGVWGICTTLKKIIFQLKPKYFVAVFDAGMTTFRNEIDPSYKANRGTPPDDLIPQFELSYQLCKSLGIHCFRKPRLEANYPNFACNLEFFLM